MESYTDIIPVNETIFGQGIPWQASFAKFIINLKRELLIAKEAPELIVKRSQKELTKEAEYMIYCMILFVLLAVLGSLVTVYELFCKDNRKKNKSLSTCDKEKRNDAKAGLENDDVALKKKDGLNVVKTFLKCFCTIRNGKKVLTSDSAEDQIGFIHGLRFLSNAWVILLHTGSVYINFLTDEEQAKPVLQSTASQLILNGHFSVDIFFVISGFLNSYLFSHRYNESHGNINWIFFYTKRFVRLTPIYMVAVGFHSILFTYTGTGTIWPNYNTNPVCKNDWWWHLLYVNNFKESAQQCLGLYWSIATDMQMYILSPLFMVSLMRWPRFGYTLVFISIAGSCFTSFMLTYLFNLPDGVSQFAYHLHDIQKFLIKYFNYFDTVYTKPYTRISSYLVGLSLGYYLFLKKIYNNTARNSKVTLSFGWVIFATFIWICFKPPSGVMLMETALYNGKKFLLFSCGVAWIIYVCFTGQSEYLKSFLSWKGFVPVSHLSYCACLIHPIILFREFLQAKNLMEFSVVSMLLLYLHIIVFTYLVSFFASILFELPLINILNWLSKMKREKKMSRLTD